MFNPVYTFKTYPKSQENIIAEKKEGTEIPMVLIPTINESIQVPLLTEAIIPNGIPIIMEIKSAARASIEVPLNPSHNMCET
jgi:hypothetical protein